MTRNEMRHHVMIQALLPVLTRFYTGGDVRSARNIADEIMRRFEKNRETGLVIHPDDPESGAAA
jgi:hypothetical protein